MKKKSVHKAIMAGLAAGAALAAGSAVAGTIDRAEFCATDTELQFIVEYTTSSTSVFDVPVGIYTVGTFNDAVADQPNESIGVNFDATTCAVTRQDPNVRQEFLSPGQDRLQAGPIPVSDYALTSIGMGQCRFEGSVPHGANPFQAGDVVPEVWIRDFNASDVRVNDVPVTACAATPGITVSAISGPTDEDGGTATFTVVLDSQPAADVSIDLSSSDPSEGTVTPATIVFSTANWDTPQIATVTGQADDMVDGDIAYVIVTSPAVSSDSNFSGIDADDVDVINLDRTQPPVVPPPPPPAAAAPVVPVPAGSPLGWLLMVLAVLAIGRIAGRAD